METSTPKLIVKATIKQEGNFERTLGTFVEHVNLSLVNSQGTILWITVGDSVWNP